MTAIFILAGIVVVVVAAIVAVTVPVRRADVAVSEFSWSRTLLIGTRVWVRRRSKRRPSSSAGTIRNVEERKGADPSRRHYTYEEQVWRKMRRVPGSGRSQGDVRWPPHVLGKDEQIRKKKQSYKVTFTSDAGRRHVKKMRHIGPWQSLQKGARYELGRNAFGAVRTINPAKTELAKRDS
jgi:hypothetical protein